MCYALEEYCRIKELRSPHSCTSQLQKWNQPRKRRLESRSVEDISFVKYEYGKTKKTAQSVMYDPRPPHMRSTTESCIQSLRDDLLSTGKDIALIHLLPFTASSARINTLPSLPPPPPVLRHKFSEHLTSQPQPVHYSIIGETGLEFLQAITYTKEQRDIVEAATRQQNICKQWFEERQFRLTASKFGVIIKRQRQHTSLVSQVLYASVSPSVSALQWGREHETDAVNAYKKTLSSNMKVTKAGIFIDKCGYLGASPDGIVIDKDGLPSKLIEVKCPFNAQDKTIKQACETKSFCCCLDEGKPHLKLDHDYFFQVQGQMAITGIHTCDFVVWTPKDVFIQTVLFDSKFWNQICLPKLKNFFFYFILPELVYPRHPSPYDYSCYKSSMYVNL